MVSIIIPARNDGPALARTLDHLCAVADGAVEIVVAASGARDDYLAAASRRATVLWPDGSTRAELMNAGAAVARGDVLWFVHADSLPPPSACALIRAALDDPRVVGGAFEHRFTERNWRLQVISAINRVRYRITGNHYGDQGIFVRAEAFRQLGGYRNLLLMEDLDFSQRLKRLGRVELITRPMDTSGRRFLQRGPWRTLLACAWLLVLWTIGADTDAYAERWRGPADRTPGAAVPKRTGRPHHAQPAD